MPYENKEYRRTKLETQVRKAIIKFSKDGLFRINDYPAEEQDEIISWANMAIAECNKRRNGEQRAKYQVVEP